jgi:hypothetical protein
MVRSAQTVHLFCIKISTISKHDKTSFHLSLVTLEYHWVHPNWFLSLWYVWRKPYTYLALTLTLSPNGPKWDSTRPASLMSSIGCVQNNFWACGILAQNEHLSCTDSNTVSKWTEKRYHKTDITYEFHQVHPKWFLSLWNIRHKPCTNLGSRLALSPNEPKRASTWASSPRSTILCVENDFRAMVCLVQTAHISCIKISTISKPTKTSFYLSRVT